MKIFNENMIVGLRISVLMLILFSLFIEPIAYSFSLIDNNEKEFVELENKKETQEEEKKEEDNQNEKFEIEILEIHQNRFLELNKVLSCEILSPLLDYSIEIPIPPPEFNDHS